MEKKRHSYKGDESSKPGGEEIVLDILDYEFVQMGEHDFRFDGKYEVIECRPRSESRTEIRDAKRVLLNDGGTDWKRYVLSIAGAKSEAADDSGDSRANALYLLLLRDGHNSAVKEAIKASIADTVITRDVRISSISDADELRRMGRIILSLFLNSLNIPKDGTGIRLNNLYAGCIILQPTWQPPIRKGHDGAGDTIVGLSVSIDENFIIHTDVRTYSLRSALLTEKYANKERIASRPAFIYDEETKTLRYFLPADAKGIRWAEERTFVQGSLHPDRKNCIPRLMFNSSSEFMSSKEGIVELLLRLLCRQFSDVIRVNRKRVAVEKYVPSENKNRRSEIYRNFLEPYDGAEICIVNCLPEMDERSLCVTALADAFRKEYGREAIVSDRPQEGCFNIVVIHEHSFNRGDEKDEYNRFVSGLSGPVVQHITVEALMPKKREGSCLEIKSYLFNVLVSECRVKNDLRLGRFSFSWQIGEQMMFGIVRNVPEIKDDKALSVRRYFLLDVSPDGSFACRVVSGLNEGADSAVMKMFGMTEDDYYVSLGDKNAVIRKAAFHVSCESEKVLRYADDFGLKGKYSRDTMFAAYYELKSFEYAGRKYYICGHHPNGETNKSNIFEKGIVPRCLDCPDLTDADIIAETVFDLLKMPILSADRIGVNPAPVKYLSEFFKLWWQQYTDQISETNTFKKTDEQ